MLQSLKVMDLRVVASADLQLHPSLNFFWGHNGQGKTSLLEGVYLLATGRSFRTHQTGHLIRNGQPFTAVDGVLSDGTNLRVAVQPKGKIFIVDQQECRWEDYLGHLQVVVYASDLLPVVKGEPESRRRFLDRGISLEDPGYLRELRTVYRTIKQRNALLKCLSREQTGITECVRELAPWDQLLLEGGAIIRQKREKYCSFLQKHLEDLPKAFKRDQLSLVYKPSLPEQGAQEALFARLERDLRMGSCTMGPHRDSLNFLVKEHPLASHGSAGQQRFSLLILKMAKLERALAVTGKMPVFLMDDIDSDLDMGRTLDALHALSEKTQVLVTTPREETLRVVTRGKKIFRVTSGAVIQEAA